MEKSSCVPQCSTLRTLVFNIFVNKIFVFLQKSELPNYVNGSAMYSPDENINYFVISLNHDFCFFMKLVL